MHHKQQYMHHSHRNNRTHNIGYYDNLTNRPRTTTELLTPHKHTDQAVKVREISSYCKSTQTDSETNSRSSNCLFIHDTYADIITIQETKLTPKAKTPKIHNFTAVRTVRLHKAGGGLITLIRYNIIFTFDY